MPRSIASCPSSAYRLSTTPLASSLVINAPVVRWPSHCCRVNKRQGSPAISVSVIEPEMLLPSLAPLGTGRLARAASGMAGSGISAAARCTPPSCATPCTLASAGVSSEPCPASPPSPGRFSCCVPPSPSSSFSCCCCCCCFCCVSADGAASGTAVLIFSVIFGRVCAGVGSAASADRSSPSSPAVPPAPGARPATAVARASDAPPSPTTSSAAATVASLAAPAWGALSCAPPLAGGVSCLTRSSPSGLWATAVAAPSAPDIFSLSLIALRCFGGGSAAPLASLSPSLDAPPAAAGFLRVRASLRFPGFLAACSSPAYRSAANHMSSR
mmetsp:Transcript_9001/g.36763  ORF Transcript_9001/g.36763 Transcript_9001/m.36763 type:complete len:328 (+) Transcript_9001:539-1522(+)